MTPDRIVHGIVALVCVAVFLSLRPPPRPVIGGTLFVVMALLGSWVPDWDLVLGIGFHRSPFTHSALPAFLFAIALNSPRWRYATTGLAIGIASHLLWDTVDYGNVVGIPGADADRLFLLGNAVVLVIASLWATRLGATNDWDEATISDTELGSSIPPEVVEDALREAVREMAEEHEQQAANRRMHIDWGGDRVAYITIGVCSVILLGYFIAAANA